MDQEKQCQGVGDVSESASSQSVSLLSKTTLDNILDITCNNTWLDELLSHDPPLAPSPTSSPSHRPPLVHSPAPSLTHSSLPIDVPHSSTNVSQFQASTCTCITSDIVIHIHVHGFTGCICKFMVYIL